MKSISRFWQLLSLTYQEATLTICVASLHKGNPDGLVGVPLVLNEESKAFKISFEPTEEYRSKSEPCFTHEETDISITDYLFERPDSTYCKEACPFGAGSSLTEAMRHFYVFTESAVIEVLCTNLPAVEPIQLKAQQDAAANP